jgi:hypothetical protein
MLDTEEYTKAEAAEAFVARSRQLVGWAAESAADLERRGVLAHEVLGSRSPYFTRIQLSPKVPWLTAEVHIVQPNALCGKCFEGDMGVTFS